MYDTGMSLSYSLGVFIIVLVSASILNLLRKHYVFQLTGIAFFFTYFLLKTSLQVQESFEITIRDLYLLSLPMFAGVSACLISMVLGFWIFPPIRKKIK